jgi:hypothetical protein
MTTRKPLAEIVLPREEQDVFFRISLTHGLDDIYIHSYEELTAFINNCMEGQGPYGYVKSISDKAWDDETIIVDKCPDCHITFSSNGRCSCDL